MEYRVGVLRPEELLRLRGGGPASFSNSIAAARGITPNHSGQGLIFPIAALPGIRGLLEDGPTYPSSVHRSAQQALRYPSCMICPTQTVRMRGPRHCILARKH